MLRLLSKMIILYLYISIATQFIQIGPIYNILFLFLLLIYILYSFKKKYISLLIGVLIIMLTTIFNGPSIESLVESSRLILFLCLIVVSSSDKKLSTNLLMYISRYKNFILYSISFFYLIILLTLLNNRFYEISSLGESTFISFFNNPHPFIYFIIFSNSLLLIINKLINSKLPLLLLLLSIVFVFQSAVRVALPIIVVLFYLIYSDSFSKSKRVIQTTFLMFALLIIVGFFLNDILYLLEQIPVFSKFINRFDNPFVNVWSNRDILWITIINAFKHSSLSRQLIGYGPLYIYDLLGGNWAHNDYLNILISYGVIILMLYVHMNIKYFYILFKKTSIIKGTLIVFSIIFTVFFNGGYNQVLFPMSMVLLISYVDTYGGRTNELSHKNT